MDDSYSLYEAKAKLSALVRQVREGGTVTITVHGVPAAELRPIAKVERTRSIAEKLHEMTARGELVAAEPASVRKLGIQPVGIHPVGIQPVARRPGALKRFLEERD